jgi:hypothetical protein
MTPGLFYWIGDRLKVGRLALNEVMLVRFQLPEVNWLGRQRADHPLSKRGMLRVQIPPEPLVRRSGFPAGQGEMRPAGKPDLRFCVVSARHGRASEAVTLAPSGCAGSTPARHAERRPRGLAEWPPDFQSGDRGFKSRRG